MPLCLRHLLGGLRWQLFRWSRSSLSRFFPRTVRSMLIGSSAGTFEKNSDLQHFPPFSVSLFPKKFGSLADVSPARTFLHVPFLLRSLGLLPDLPRRSSTYRRFLISVRTLLCEETFVRCILFTHPDT